MAALAKAWPANVSVSLRDFVFLDMMNSHAVTGSTRFIGWGLESFGISITLDCSHTTFLGQVCFEEEVWDEVERVSPLFKF